MKTVLAIGGWDPTSGAGITADVKAIHGAGAYALTAITGLAVQTPSKVISVRAVPLAVVKETLEQALTGFELGAVKTGMLGSPRIAREVFQFVRGTTVPWVFDPVSKASDGTALGAGAVKQAFPRKGLSIVTPNVPEMEALTGLRLTSKARRDQAFAMLHEAGWDAVLLKGGHARGTQVEDEFSLRYRGRFLHARPRVKGSLHGSGCTLASALAANLALGFDPAEAFYQAELFMDQVWAMSMPAGAQQKDRRLSILPVGRSVGRR